MSTRERIQWPPPQAAEWMFDGITEEALDYAKDPALNHIYRKLLALLFDCEFGVPGNDATRGATFKQLAYIGHQIKMDDVERRVWYEIAQELGLTQRHAGHIIARMDDRGHTLEAWRRCTEGGQELDAALDAAIARDEA